MSEVKEPRFLSIARPENMKCEHLDKPAVWCDYFDYSRANANLPPEALLLVLPALLHVS